MPDPYFSEIKYLGGPSLDFIEVAVDAGTDVSSMVVTIYNASGTVRSSNALSGLTFTTIAGRDVYVIESGAPGTFTGLGKSNGLAFQSQFLAPNPSGPTSRVVSMIWAWWLRWSPSRPGA